MFKKILVIILCIVMINQIAIIPIMASDNYQENIDWSTYLYSGRAQAVAMLCNNIAANPEKKDDYLEIADKFLGDPIEYSELSDEIKGEYMASINMLFHTICQYPEKSDLIIDTFKKYSGFQKSSLPLSEAEQIGRMYSLESLYYSIGINPEAKDLLYSVADEFLGEPSDYESLPEKAKAIFMSSIANMFYIVSRESGASSTIIETAKKYSGFEKSTLPLSKEEQVAKMKSLYMLYISIARQPEAKDGLYSIADEFLRELTDYDSLAEEAKAIFLQSIAGVFESIARQPEASNDIIEAVKKYSGFETLALPLSETEQIGRMYSLYKLYESIASNPEAKDKLYSVADEFLGEPSDYSSLPDEAKAAFLQSIGILFQNIARQPEVADTLIEAAKKYSGFETLTLPLSETEQVAKMYSLNALYKSLAINQATTDKLYSVADEFLGEPSDYSSLSDKTKAAFIRSIGSMFQSIVRQPEATNILVEATKKYSGFESLVLPLSESEQIARIYSLSTLYESIARQPEAKDTLYTVADEFLGESRDYASLSDEAKAACIQSLSEMFYGIELNPEAKNALIATQKKYLGFENLTLPLSKEEEMSRMSVIIDVLDIHLYGRNTDGLFNLVDNYLGFEEDLRAMSLDIRNMRNYATSILPELVFKNTEKEDQVIDFATRYLGTAEQFNSYLLPKMIVADTKEVNLYFEENIDSSKFTADKSNFSISNNNVTFVTVKNNIITLELTSSVQKGEKVTISYNGANKYVYSNDDSKIMPSFTNIPIENISMLSNANLSMIKINGNSIENYDNSKVKYDITFPAEINSINITPIAANPESNIKIGIGEKEKATKLSSGNTSNEFSFDNSNSITIKIYVTSQDKTKEKTYTLNISKEEVVETIDDSGTTFNLTLINTETGLAEVKTLIEDFLNPKNIIEINSDNSRLTIHASSLDSHGISGANYIKISERIISGDHKKELINHLPSEMKTIGSILNFTVQLFDANDNFIKDIYQLAENQTIKITIKLTGDQIKDIDTSKLSMYYYDDDKKEWVNLGGSFDNSLYEFSFKASSFGKFAIMTTHIETQETLPEKELKTEPKADNNVLIVLGSLVLVLFIGVLLFRKRKNIKSK